MKQKEESIFLNKDWSQTESEIKPGDIIIQLVNGYFPSDEPLFKASIPKDKQTSLSPKPCRPAHITIAASDSVYVHANPFSQGGGKVYALGFFDDTSGSDNVFERVALGEFIVLRSTNELLREQITRFAKLYDDSYTYKGRLLRNYEVCQLREDIPFRMQKSRRLDEIKRDEKTHELTDQGNIERSQLELFRAFRAYSRMIVLENSFKTQTKGAQPLSKNQGLSCANFVTYIHKAAVIATRFPDGLEAGSSIRAIYDKIEASIPRFPIKLMPETYPNENACYVQFQKSEIVFTLIKDKISVHIEILLSELIDPMKKKPLFTWYQPETIKDRNLLLQRVEKNRSLIFDMLIKKASPGLDLSFLKHIGKLDAVLAHPHLFTQWVDSVSQFFASDEMRLLQRAEKDAGIKDFVNFAMNEKQAWKAGICVKEASNLKVTSYEDYQQEISDKTKTYYP